MGIQHTEENFFLKPRLKLAHLKFT